MMEYIKKLRACIKWLLEKEDEHLTEIMNITSQLETQGKQNSEIGTSFSN
jgi:kinesin family protein C1